MKWSNFQNGNIYYNDRLIHDDHWCDHMCWWSEDKCTPHAGHSTHFQIGGDNPKLEGQEFFYPSTGSSKMNLS